MEPQDKVIIAPSALITVARHAALEVPGVAHMATIPVNVTRLLHGSPMGSGVVLELDDQKVGLDLYVAVKPDINMKAVSQEIQLAVKRSIEELVGMEVVRVNVHIEDVEYTAPVYRPEA